MAVPTDDKKVKERLRAYGEPITLFGEGVSLSEASGKRLECQLISVAWRQKRPFKVCAGTDGNGERQRSEGLRSGRQ
jgi:hypothetical protein